MSTEKAREATERGPEGEGGRRLSAEEKENEMEKEREPERAKERETKKERERHAPIARTAQRFMAGGILPEATWLAAKPKPICSRMQSMMMQQ